MWKKVSREGWSQKAQEAFYRLQNDHQDAVSGAPERSLLKASWRDCTEAWRGEGAKGVQGRLYDTLQAATRKRLLGELPGSSRPTLETPPSLDEKGQIRLRSCSGNGASAWLGAIPFDSNHKIFPPLFRTAMRVRLGLRIPELVRQPVCGCGQRGDLEGVHGGKCPTGGGPWRRHQKVGAAFFELLTGVRYCTVGGETTMGSLGLDLTGPLAEERDKRPDLFASLPNGDSILGDVALIHPIQDATRLHRNAKKAGAATKEKEGKKHTHYDDACRAVGIRFVPLVFETYGRPGGETVRFVKEMVRQATERLGEMNDAPARQKIADRWWKTLSVAVQKAAASTILASVQASRGARGTQVTEMLLGREFSAYVGLAEKKE
uniref:Uncharacterized protein n=1 Tax=Chromera velia CCMP2878 TaxID=1169474 RepID=A0A0G4F8I0_9ALVE|eukprot:Cvel_15635.t1-p1 / transcript=Cvel_15635.t1 / gene=Cvel_15635 / organism=Chromera_velia_CCMP2878 / gene_product=hypothetical protein / transcript_product=hypothetical protein / location=Cvel_scaffold1165:21170-22297(+) / protein_length=376 / sequence_SO=supercontig / SO=protein_coding / is_pseudo=false